MQKMGHRVSPSLLTNSFQATVGPNQPKNFSYRSIHRVTSVTLTSMSADRAADSLFVNKCTSEPWVLKECVSEVSLYANVWKITQSNAIMTSTLEPLEVCATYSRPPIHPTCPSKRLTISEVSTIAEVHFLRPELLFYLNCETFYLCK